MTPQPARPAGVCALGWGLRMKSAVADGIVAAGEFEDAVEDQASAAGGAAVEAEHELV